MFHCVNMLGVKKARGAPERDQRCLQCRGSRARVLQSRRGSLKVLACCYGGSAGG